MPGASNTRRRRTDNPERQGLSVLAVRLLVGCIALLVAWQVYSRMILPSGLLAWDEAAHALRGVLIARDLRQGDGLACSTIPTARSTGRQATPGW